MIYGVYLVMIATGLALYTVDTLARARRSRSSIF